MALGLLLAATARAEWLKIYQSSPVRENWTVYLDVEDFDKDLPRVLESLAKSKALITRPLSGFASSRRKKVQQLSYRIPEKKAGKALKKLRKIGRLEKRRVIPSPRVPIKEVREKTRKLSAEKKAHAEALSRMPAVSALVSELLEHLRHVESVEKSERSVLVNLTIRESEHPH